MNTFSTRIRPLVSLEIAAAARARTTSDSFVHLERAHVLGQASTREHVRVHFHMLVWAVRHRRRREALGQVLRVLGAAILTGVGMIPAGNTGGSNVSPFQKMTVAPDLAELIDRAHGPR
jgi:Protein of unknown function (DUF3703)